MALVLMASHDFYVYRHEMAFNPSEDYAKALIAQFRVNFLADMTGPIDEYDSVD